MQQFFHRNRPLFNALDESAEPSASDARFLDSPSPASAGTYVELIFKSAVRVKLCQVTLWRCAASRADWSTPRETHQSVSCRSCLFVSSCVVLHVLLSLQHCTGITVDYISYAYRPVLRHTCRHLLVEPGTVAPLSRAVSGSYSSRQS
jgi:hypothetical protein